jgi:DNA (cytosine-5)-methyltransferase 1
VGSKKQNKKTTVPLVAADLFCGAGGMSLAARDLGIRVVAAVDNYGHAAETYKENFINHRRKANRPTFYEEDILQLSPARILEDHQLKPGDLDILIGAPPCQGYSSHRINDQGVDDPRNELLLRYFEFIRIIQPKAFVVENVPGMLWPRHARYLNKFKALTKKARYQLYGPEVLNARDYGVPQNRKRVFMVGFRHDLDVNFSWPSATHLAPESKLLKTNGHLEWEKAKVVFDIPIAKSDPNSIHMKHSQDIVDAFKRTPKNGGSRRDSGRELACHKDHDGHKDVYGRIDPSKPGPTMTTACINPSKGRFVHPTANHGITVRHAARFQCFPDNFIFHGGLTAAGIQVGNAVPILFGRSVIGAICESIRSSTKVGDSR